MRKPDQLPGAHNGPLPTISCYDEPLTCPFRSRGGRCCGTLLPILVTAWSLPAGGLGFCRAQAHLRRLFLGSARDSSPLHRHRSSNHLPCTATRGRQHGDSPAGEARGQGAPQGVPASRRALCSLPARPSPLTVSPDADREARPPSRHRARQWRQPQGMDPRHPRPRQQPHLQGSDVPAQVPLPRVVPHRCVRAGARHPVEHRQLCGPR